MKNERDFSDIVSSPKTDSPDGNAGDQAKNEELLFLARMLRKMPDREPPPDLAEAVLQSIESKKIPAWRRLYIWAATPRFITVLPIKFIPAAAAIVLVLFVTMHFLPKDRSFLVVDQREQRLVSVTFTFHDPQARFINLIGSFNQWNPRGFEMRPAGTENIWVLELRLPEGRHEYAFLVDGEGVVSDPNAPFSKSDGFGNTNSIIFVTNDHEKTT